MWELRNLLRGRRGTEWAAAGRFHYPGERFVILDQGGIHRITLTRNDLNNPVFFKAVPEGAALDEVATVTLETFMGRSVRCLIRCISAAAGHWTAILRSLGRTPALERRVGRWRRRTAIRDQRAVVGHDRRSRRRHRRPITP